MGSDALDYAAARTDAASDGLVEYLAALLDESEGDQQ
jgi:hypothetical protein